MYAFSRLVDGKRQTLSVEELKDNVVFLIGNTHEIPHEREHFLVNKNIEHKWIENGVAKWYTGRVISQVFYSKINVVCLIFTFIVIYKYCFVFRDFKYKCSITYLNIFWFNFRFLVFRHGSMLFMMTIQPFIRRSLVRNIRRVMSL